MKAADALFQYRRDLKVRLDGCFARKDDPKKRFAPIGVTREIFERGRLEHLFGLLFEGQNDLSGNHDLIDLPRLAETIRGSQDSRSYCNVLATLLYSRCADQNLRDFARNILHEKPGILVSDDDLPLAQQAARDTFGTEDGPSFWVDQYSFCPVVLIEKDESRYLGDKASCPLPFLKEPVEIGLGAYGVVRKVIIEKGHLINRREKFSNECNEYAQKEYFGYDAQARLDFTAEMATMTKLIRSRKSHANVLTTRASLEWGKTYSLFFDLAKGDLWQYFTNRSVVIENINQKATIFGRTIGLASALAYLHEELDPDDTNEQLQCYHLDLKPQNILVFELDGNDIWKVSDFGISKIKTVRHGKKTVEYLLPLLEPLNALTNSRWSEKGNTDSASCLGQSEPVSEHFLDRVLKPKKKLDPTSGIQNARFGGTYAAPEAKEKSEMVTRKSDVWSLGCVLALVLTFLDSQSFGIAEFQEARQKDRNHDWFFDAKALKPGSDHTQILHSSVSDWLHELTNKASNRGKAEGTAIYKAVTLLQDQMLKRDEDQRLTAKDVERELRRIHSCFTSPTSSSSTPDQLRPTKLRWSVPRPHLHFPKLGSGTTAKPWEFEIPKMANGCKFSPSGFHLAVASSDIITLRSTVDIKHGRQGITHESRNGTPWADFTLGSKYLCVAARSQHLKCSFIPFSTGNSSESMHVEKESEPPIRRVVLSPNDEIVAFLQDHDQSRKKPLKVVLYQTHDLMHQATSSDSVRSESEANPSPMPTIRHPQKFDLPPTDDLVDFKFCSNSKVLIAVTIPYREEEDLMMRYTILSWDIVSGRLVSRIKSTNEGSDNMTQSWSIRSLAIFAYRPSFATISRQKIHLGDYDPPKYETFTNILGGQLLDVLVDRDEDWLVLISNTAQRGRIKAFRVPVDNLENMESLGRGTPIGVQEYESPRDASCLQDESEERVLLIASLNTRRQKGQLYQVLLD